MIGLQVQSIELQVDCRLIAGSNGALCRFAGLQPRVRTHAHASAVSIIDSLRGPAHWSPSCAHASERITGALRPGIQPAATCNTCNLEGANDALRCNSNLQSAGRKQVSV